MIKLFILLRQRRRHKHRFIFKRIYVINEFVSFIFCSKNFYVNNLQHSWAWSTDERSNGHIDICYSSLSAIKTLTIASWRYNFTQGFQHFIIILLWFEHFVHFISILKTCFISIYTPKFTLEWILITFSIYFPFKISHNFFYVRELHFFPSQNLTGSLFLQHIRFSSLTAFQFFFFHTNK